MGGRRGGGVYIDEWSGVGARGGGGGYSVHECR